MADYQPTEPLTRQNSCQIDDSGPLPVVQPTSISDLCHLVRRAAADNQALYPFGGQTMLDLGLPPARPGIAIDMRNFNQVIDYPARDMTVTVQAGITITALQDLLRKENQRLPIDVPQPDRATLGGVIATNVSGPHRFGFGTLRDYVIGITVVNDEGQEVKAGGRVVKNVAGYDMCKLYIGSLGTLGIITQVTLKLRPLPDEQAVMILGCSTENLELVLDLLHQSRTRPVCLDMLNGAAIGAINRRWGLNLPDAPWIVLVGFEDNREAVDWQVQQLEAELAVGRIGNPSYSSGTDLNPSCTCRGDEAASFWQVLTEFMLLSEARLSFKANMLPSATAAFCRQAAALPDGLCIQAHAGNGIVIGHATGETTLEHAQAMLTTLHDAVQAAEGNIIVTRCPTAWKKSLPIWGVPRGDAWLVRLVKEKLDPRDLFNSGRFVVSG